MKKIKKQFRQGDVLVEQVAKITQPIKSIPRENGRLILAHGEVTFHAHAICEAADLSTPTQQTAQAAPIQVSELEIKAALAMLVHDEHGTIQLERGSYRVTRQREYHPAAIRNVAD